jgi:hypothetical protein
LREVQERAIALSGRAGTRRLVEDRLNGAVLAQRTQ